jgi:predicted DNA-binding antitoxin AbrB/MazE fold protein
MSLTIEAIYENGMLKPTRPLPLPEHAKVRITIEPATSWVEATAGICGWKGDHETLQRLLDEAEEPEDLP